MNDLTCSRCGLHPAHETNTAGVCPECQLTAMAAVDPITAPAGVALPPFAAPSPPPSAQAIAVRAPVEMAERGVLLRSLDDLARFASMVVKSGMAPKGMERPEAVAVAVQAGMELGFSPLRALSVVYVVNGRPALMGTAALAKIRASGLLKSGTTIESGVSGSGNDKHGWVQSWREGLPSPVKRTYSVADATAAGLWKKSGPWTSDPDMMLIWRAVGRHARMDWSDVLLGLELAEVQRDHDEHAPPRVLNPPSVPDPVLTS